MTNLIENAKNNLIFEQASPLKSKSPRLDTGQIASKRQLLYEKNFRGGLNSSEVKDTSTPGGQGTSSEYSLRSKEKKMQILDSSVRTVSINIDAPGNIKEELRKKPLNNLISEPQLTEEFDNPFLIHKTP